MKQETLRPGEPVRQFSVLLANRAGALVSLTHLLKREHIELLGISVQDSRDATVARLVLSDPDGAEALFMEKGIPHTVSELVVVGFREVGEDLLKCLDTLRLAEVNIDFAYGLLPHPKGLTLMAFHLDDGDFAANVLHSAGFKVLNQQELSR
ncbi:hypothetical protein [Roseibacillus ishigakijimensis]|uniref:ACT domain-containing protein n=1 Tax=Roseibacillus ishigakijimensis TaxID=454146 RepID=A0A934RKH1_9BACT|nr:hypothetical protein [Roseibacillus ishigakijimensis]